MVVHKPSTERSACPAPVSAGLLAIVSDTYHTPEEIAGGQRLHHRRGRGHDHPYHRRQLPPHQPPRRADRTHPVTSKATGFSAVFP